jgi:glycosyltransferase involved in cell wall biosynthesis
MQPGPNPQTTVLIPVWDDYAGARLSEALASLAEQDGVKRVLIVDNASDVPIAAGAEAEVVRTPRRLALGAARNFGLERVSTRYVVVWDADDVMLPGSLEFLEAAISADPELTAFAAAIVESPSGRRYRWPRRWIAHLTRRPRMFALLHSIWSLYPTTGATIMCSEHARAAGGYGVNESGDDWVLGVSLAFRGRIGWSERPARVYRLHRDSVWMRHADVGHLRRHAAEVRGRVRSDAQIPSWARRSLPLIAVGQYAAIGAHVLVAAARRSRNHDRRLRLIAALSTPRRRRN